MAFRIPALRHALRHPLVHPRPSIQRRWAAVHDVRFLATRGADERVMAKYRAKLVDKAKAEGLEDVSQLKEQYKEKIDELRTQAIVPGATGPLTPPPSPVSTSESELSDGASTAPSSPSSPSPSPKAKPKPSDPNAPPPGVKTLDDYLNLDKVRALPNKEVEALWRLRHAANPQSMHFAVPADTFASLLRAAKQHPAFVLPVPREIPSEQTEAGVGSQQAAELHYLQFAHPHKDTTTLLFTSLAEFKLRGEFASPHTTVTFHQELAESHGLVLGQGLVIENRGVSVDEARWLVMCMQKFYVKSDEGRGRSELLDMFSRGDAGFSVERLIDEAEKIL